VSYTAPAWLPDWITIASDGRVSWYDGLARGQGKRCQSRKGTTDEAERYARHLMTQAEKASSLSVALGTTWTDLAHAWVAAHDGKITEGTLRRRMSALNVWVIPHVGDVELVDTSLATLLTVADAAALTLGMSGFDSTVQTMTHVGAWGMERNWLPDGAFGTDEQRQRAMRAVRRLVSKNAAAKALSDGDTDRGVTFEMVPTWADVCALADAVTDRVGGRARSRAVGERYGRAVRVSAGTGLRLCELLGLHTSQVNLDAGLIDVRHQLNRYKAWDGTGPMPTAPPKFGRRRTVGAWASIRDDLAAAVDEAVDGVLFPPYDGQAWWADAWGRLLLATRDDVEWLWAPHWLRHHYGSYSLTPREHGGLGLPAATVQHYLGHKKLTTTLDTYTQPVAAPTGWLL
jgi:integrase